MNFLASRSHVLSKSVSKLFLRNCSVVQGNIKYLVLHHMLLPKLLIRFYRPPSLPLQLRLNENRSVEQNILASCGLARFNHSCWNVFKSSLCFRAFL